MFWFLDPVFESPAFVCGFDDFTVMGKPVEKSGRHLRVTEDARPFPERQVEGDDDRCAFVEFADQMEQELSACLGEWQVSQLIEDQEIETGDQIGGPALPVCARLGIQLVDQIDDIEEPSPGSVADTSPDDADGQMGFAGSGSPDQDQTALMIQEVPAGQAPDERFVDGRRFEVEFVQFLGQGELGDRHLVFDRTGLLLADLGIQQVADDLLRVVLTLDRRGHDLIVGRLHPVELQLSHCVQHMRSFHSPVSSSCRTGRNLLLVHS